MKAQDVPRPAEKPQTFEDRMRELAERYLQIEAAVAAELHKPHVTELNWPPRAHTLWRRLKLYVEAEAQERGENFRKKLQEAITAITSHRS
ncbi:hypothetical protein KW782_02200 [Candidatus Parcubacteria bacterium]|nr:hypothetical protein [Candidatus Parcubacteria bacterium]